jgi:hypothetical protein
MLTNQTAAADLDVDAGRTDPAVQLLAIGLLRHLAHLHGVNESLVTGERQFEVAIPGQSRPSQETPRDAGVSENHDET